MPDDDIVILIYRSLRDSFINSIAYVDYDEKEQSIYLKLNRKPLKYPCYGEEEDSKENLSFGDSLWKINKKWNNKLFF